MITIAAPIAIEKKGEFYNDLSKLFKEGFYRFMIDGKSYRLNQKKISKQFKLQKTYKHYIDLLIDAVDIIASERSRINEAVETATKLSGWHVQSVL